MVGQRLGRARDKAREAAGRAYRRARETARREGPFTLLLRWIGRAALAFVALSLLAVILLRFLNPPTTLLILTESWRLGGVEQRWRPLSEITPDLRRATIAAEDARFCEHRGFDRVEMKRAIARWREGGGRLIGASTISQQTAKNVFLWPARSLLRKVFEFWFTALIEVLWPKERILEVYLNVAEFGEGVFGVEAAAQAAFGVSAAELSLDQAARLASVLPAPRRYSPVDGSPGRVERIAAIIDGARTLAKSEKAACVGG